MKTQEQELTKHGDTYRNFRLTYLKEIPEIRCTLRELVHEPTGAHVLHLANDDPENLFCLSFRTTPTSSNGVAHILEHTVLCGSEKYPIKDPFFAMTRRSLNTFMNAMTGADFTCYPAASQVPKDFYNLLEVYLDAVFAPKIEELSFKQEGCRLEFAKPEDPTTPLEYKGIVYNEMKGVLASPSARLDDILSEALCPDLTYGFNSGGDPKVIPQLTYEEFKTFYDTYYHPTRCLFYFYGNLPLTDHLDFIADKTLDKAKGAEPLPPIPRQPRYTQPIKRSGTYPAGPDVDDSDKAYVTLGWLTCHILDLDEVLALEVIDSALMDTDASPLRLALLKSGLCKQAGSSLEDEISEVPFTITLRGCEASNADAIEKFILDELKRIAKEGIPEKLVDSAMHQMELYRSEITGDSSPFGLNLFWRSALLKQHAGSAEHGLLIHSLFARLRQLIKEDPQYLSKLIEKHLINNTHRVTVVMTPDKDLTRREDAEERATLAAIKDSLTPEDTQKLVDQAKALYKFQKNQEDQDIDCLPKLTLDDVPKNVRDFPIIIEKIGNITTFRHSCFTNGIVYAEMTFNMSEIVEADLPYVRLFGNLMSQVACGNRNYREVLEFMHENTGGVGTSLSLNPHIDRPKECTPSFVVKGKALYRKGEQLFSLMHDMITAVDFTDAERITEILQKHYTGLEASFNNHAMRYALSLSASYLDVSARIHYAWFGLEYYQMIRDLVKNLPARLPELTKKLMSLREQLLDRSDAHLIISCDEEYYQKLAAEKFYGLASLGKHQMQPWKPKYEVRSVEPQACVISSAVSFNGKTFATPTYLEPDAAYLSLAGNILDNTVLHQKIREEGGAYGSGAGNNTMYGHFYFYSYRDPNIAATFNAFEEAVKAIAEGDFDDDDLEEAKLEIIQDADSPVAPGSRSGVGYGWWRAGKTPEIRQKFRDRILGATKEDIQNAVKRHLVGNVTQAPPIVFAGKELLDKEAPTLATLGMPELKRLVL